jgi:hypothetical protein
MRLAFGKQVVFIGDDDVGAISAFSMVGTLAYLLFDRRRLLNVACVICCAVALVAATRSATLGAVLALA